VGFIDIEQYIDSLAEMEISGRQLRNALTTARQLTNYEEKMVDYSHLERATKISCQFEKCLTNVRGRTNTLDMRPNIYRLEEKST
jgi:hypothetical protein